jgi:hypothetical protein
MRILRGLSSRLLPCGCLTGLYETYDSEVVRILDARGPFCGDPAHQPGQTLRLEEMNTLPGVSSVPFDRRPPSA